MTTALAWIVSTDIAHLLKAYPFHVHFLLTSSLSPVSKSLWSPLNLSSAANTDHSSVCVLTAMSTGQLANAAATAQTKL